MPDVCTSWLIVTSVIMVLPLLPPTLRSLWWANAEYDPIAVQVGREGD